MAQEEKGMPRMGDDAQRKPEAIAIMAEHGTRILALAKDLTPEAKAFIQRAVDRVTDQTTPITFGMAVDAVWKSIHSAPTDERRLVFEAIRKGERNYGEEALGFIERLGQ